MHSLYVLADAEAIKSRIAQLTPDSPRQWGKMSAAQTLAHCTGGLQMATGELRPPRVAISRLFGPIIKPMVLAGDTPMRRNSPTMPDLLISGEPDFATEQSRLCRLIDQFHAAGPAACTTHPHAFFGRLTPPQWAVLMYKHLDHHLRQFGV